MTARVGRIQAVQETQLGIITNTALQLQQLAGRVDKLVTRIDDLSRMQQHTDGRLNIVISQLDELGRRLDDQRKPQ